MNSYNYLYGPVPSRRMGLSLGVSPIPKKTCNYSCIYCQLGRTDKMTNTREDFFSLDDIKKEFKEYISNNNDFDVITIVGEGEPTLYKSLGELIDFLKSESNKPVALITNGSLLKNAKLQEELSNLDILLPSLDATTEEEFIKINRPYPKIKFEDVIGGLIEFSKFFKGQLWIELMLVRGFNDSNESIERFSEILDKIDYDRLFINTPIRPPSEDYANEPYKERLNYAVDKLKGTSINLLSSEGFASKEKDDYEAILSIIKRHPMNQYEIKSFIKDRCHKDTDKVLEKLEENSEVEKISYKGYITYRLY